MHHIGLNVTHLPEKGDAFVARIQVMTWFVFLNFTQQKNILIECVTMEPIVNVIGNESQKIVWITLINKGYIDFTKNFLMSIKNHCITDFELVIYCIDDESFNTFNDNDLCFCIRIEKSLPLELQTWGLAGYKEIVFTKLDVILNTLKNNEKHVAVAIGFID